MEAEMVAPSCVEVPRPSSSSSSSVRGPRLRSASAASASSFWKVERPRHSWSAAPMRVNSARIGVSAHASAGTYEPSCASSTMSPTCRA